MRYRSNILYTSNRNTCALNCSDCSFSTCTRTSDKHIHKFHHRFKAPTAVASMYANPIEFAIGNLLGVVFGPYLTGAHPYTAYFWLVNALWSTGGSHSGYLFFDCETHDWHHEHFDYQFGVMGMWDAICGTGFEGSKKWERVMAKQAKLQAEEAKTQ